MPVSSEFAHRFMQNENNKFINWLLFLLISVIWGSSFILMKKGMFGSAGQTTLSSYQVAAVRIASAGIFLLPVALNRLGKIPRNKFIYIILSGFIGSFLPAFLFCVAELRIDSSLAGFLNALTPIFTIVIGAFFFHSKIAKGKAIGVALAFAGMLLLFLAKGEFNFQYLSFASFVLIATICYGFNVNIVGRYLSDVSSTNISAIGFAALVLPALVILYSTGFFQLPLSDRDMFRSTLASVVLGIMGTAVAHILFYILLKRAGTLFASMVTYGAPFVALGWGLLDGEFITPLQVLGLAIILTGVYRVSRAS